MARGITIEAGFGQARDLAGMADVVVSERMGQPTRFELQLPAGVRGGDIPALLDGRVDPGQPVSVFAEDGRGGIDCLVSGEVDGQAIRLIDGGEGSRLTVLGGDVTIAMDREVKVAQWTMPDGAAIMAVCAAYGIVCTPMGGVATRMSLQHPLVQRATDLGFLRMLARRNGCQFWVRPMAARVGPVIQRGHFQPPGFADGDLATLRLNASPGPGQPAPNTVDALDIDFATTAPTEVAAGGVDIPGVATFTADTDLSTMAALGRTPVAQIGPGPRRHRLTAPGDGASDLVPRGAGVLAEAQFFLSARTTTTVRRLGRIVHAHDTVRVIGAGSRHSGRYYVAAVTHRINEEAHTMDLQLIRNAWGEETGPLPGILS
ncbi:MAG: hypothetical protein ACXIU8_13780 [Alkalilacustris sp.]